MKNLHLFLLFPSIIYLIWQGLSYPFKSLSIKENITRLYFRFLSLGSLFLGLLVGMSFLGGRVSVLELVPLNFTPLKGWIFLCSNILFGVVAHFSFNYLHKDRGYSKFFLNYNIFWLGIFFFIFGHEPFVLFAGWELIGVSSIFLIGYYSYRPSPILNSLYVVSFYKFADIILITCLLLLQHNEILQTHNNYAPFLYCGIIIAGLIKSGSFPFTPWLPKAMEGPTTSSAIFYGALSINTGVLLIVFYLDEILVISSATSLLATSGFLTLIYSSFQTRVQTNAKSLLAYSSSIQIGLILIELSFGFKHFALVHLFFSSFYKVYQFIKSPSLLYSFHEMVGENEKSFNSSGFYFYKIFPKRIRSYLYFQNLHHFHLNSLYETLAEVSYKLSYFAERLFFPLINKGKKVSLWTLMWIFYYLTLSYFINNNAIEIHEEYFKIIPFFILLVSLSMVHQKNTTAFIALMMIYKILESFIVHGVHSHEPYKFLGYAILTIFIFCILIYEKSELVLRKYKKILGPVLIFLMLYFTNFPFLLQSLVNEHIIEAFLEQGKFMNLGFYCLANTFFNIALYQFIFNSVYLQQIDKEKYHA